MTAPARRLLYYTDLPLTVLVICAIYATFCKYLEGEGCKCSAAAGATGICLNGGSLVQLPTYVPEGFPCGRPTLHQTAWLLKHPSASFLLSALPTHRCWMFVTAVLSPFIWLLSCILVSAASPSAPADYGIRLRLAFLPLIRIVPEAMALAQLASQGPIPTVMYIYKPAIYTQLNQVAALLHVITTSIGHTGLLDLPVILALSLIELLLTLTIPYLLSMHGHATWTAAFVATITFTSLGVPSLLAACMSGWKSSCRGQRRRLHSGDSCEEVGGRQGAAFSGGADEQKQLQQLEKVPAATCVNRSVAGRSGDTGNGAIATRGGGAGDRTAAALASASLLGAAAAAVAANNRARDANVGVAPFDDPELWASVILIRKILAQPMAEYQPMFTRQRVSIKVGPCSLMGSCFVEEEAPRPRLLYTCFDACPCAIRSPGTSRSSCPPTGGLLYRRFGTHPRHRALSSMSASGGEIGEGTVIRGSGDGLPIRDSSRCAH